MTGTQSMLTLPWSGLQRALTPWTVVGLAVGGSSRDCGGYPRPLLAKHHRPALLFVLAARTLLTGVFEIMAATRLREEIKGEWLLTLGGMALILFAVIVAIRPAAGAVALVWLIGIYAIVFGILLIILGFRLRGWGRRYAAGLRGSN